MLQKLILYFEVSYIRIENKLILFLASGSQHSILILTSPRININPIMNKIYNIYPYFQ